MPARTPLPAKPVMALMRARRAGAERRAPEPAPEPSAELVEIRQLRADLTPQIPTQQTHEPSTVTVTVVDEDWLRPWLYRHRHVLRVLYAALVLAASKLLILAPSFLPLIGLAVAVGLGIAAAMWARKTSTATVLTKGQRANLADLGDDARRWVERLASPRAGAVATIVCAAGWWLRPDDLLTASIALAASAGVVAGVRAHRFRIRPVQVTATVIEDGPVERWYPYVAEKEREAAGSRVTGMSPVINPDGEQIGFTLGVEFPPGSKGATAVLPSLRPRIRTAYGVGDKDVILAPDQDNDTRLAVTVLNEPGRNALDAIHEYDGTTDFDPATGIFTHGIRADWTRALIQLYDPEVGAYHGHFSGVTRAGKSEGIETLLRSVTQHGVVVPVFIDLGEVTFVDWREHSPVFVTDPIQAVILLRNIKALGHLRQQKMGKLRRYDEQGQDIGPCRVYPVSETTPMVLPVFDEWQFGIGKTDRLPDWLATELGVKTVGDAILALTKDILTQYSKAMIGMLLAGQASGLMDGFRNCPPVRAQCQAGYMVGYRNTPESGRQVFGGNISVDPSTIPLDRKGTNYLTSSADARDSRSRTQWVRTPRLFDHLIRVGRLPEDELAVLLRGIADTRGDAEDEERGESVEDAAVIVERPSLTVINTSADDQLKEAMKAWARKLDRPVQRQEFLAEFKGRRGVASRYKVDKALADLKDADEFDADDKGFYTLKEAA
jgi:hypothetical protein